MKNSMLQWVELARQVSLGVAPDMNILRERGSDVRIARVSTLSNGSVVVKLWNRSGLRWLVRYLSLSSAARREWTALKRLAESGVPVPEPLAYIPRLTGPAAHTQALITRDLGECGDVLEYLKELIQQGDQEKEQTFCDEIIRVTAVMVRLGLLDTDHRLPNFVVDPSGRPVRLDFELNVRRPLPRLWTRKYGLMLGTLLGSFVFAVQPDTSKVYGFASRLRRALEPPESVLRVAEQRMLEMLRRQELETGLQIKINYPWEIN